MFSGYKYFYLKQRKLSLVKEDDSGATLNTESNENDINQSFITNSKDITFAHQVTINFPFNSISTNNPYSSKGFLSQKMEEIL